MQTLTIDIINSKALGLLQELELLQLIRVRKQEPKIAPKPNFIKKYKGAMTKQSLNEVDTQLTELRNEWD